MTEPALDTEEQSENDLLESQDFAEDNEVCNDDIENDANDPFALHFTLELDSTLLESVQSSPMRSISHNANWPALGDIKINIPVQLIEPGLLEAGPLLDDHNFTKPGQVPQRILNTDLNSLCVKSQIHKNLKLANQKQLEGYGMNDCLTPLQKELFSIMNNYQDLYFNGRDLANGEEVRFVYCLHTVNHILKTRLKIIHHNERLNKKDRCEMPDEFRDQGLVRPKVLIIAPFRDSCYKIVNMIAELLLSDNRANVINKARFKEEFTGGGIYMPQKTRKPEDFEQLFTGNVDDSFRIGLNFTKKSLKLYTDFYSSDVIVASPLGLRTLIGAEGDKERDFDFLTSIEVLILDQAEMYLMQVYRRFETSSVISATEDRFQYFVTEILPQFFESTGVLIYVPSYFDYVRIRNYLRDQDRSFVQICEYSKDGKVARARDMFYHNEARMLIYSERFHFFRRITLKGIRHLVFYQPPTFPNFYSELCNFMQESNQNKVVDDANFSVDVLFCKYDVHQLSGIVRTARAARIVSAEKPVHLFTTGQ